MARHSLSTGEIAMLACLIALMLGIGYFNYVVKTDWIRSIIREELEREHENRKPAKVN